MGKFSASHLTRSVGCSILLTMLLATGDICLAKDRGISISVSGSQSWPGGGSALTLRVSGSDGLVDTDLSNEIGIYRVGKNAEYENRVIRAPLPAGHTIVALMASEDDEENGAIADSAMAFIESRPPAERISIYRWGERLHQLRDFSTDRGDLLSVFEVDSLLNGSGHLMSTYEAVSYLTNEVQRTGGGWHPGLRSVVLIGHRIPHAAPMPEPVPLVHWIVGQVSDEQIDRIGRTNIFLSGSRINFTGAALSASGSVDEFARRGHYRIAVCADPAGGYVNLSVGSTLKQVYLQPALEEEKNEKCDIGRITAGARSFPDKIRFTFSGSQRDIYNRRIKGRSKSDFQLFLHPVASGDGVAATAHLRGKYSLSCDRKSYTLEIDDDKPRYLLPRSGASAFYLLSLCRDDRFVHQYTILQLWKSLGLFPFEFDFVELMIEDESAAVYLLIEKAMEKLWTDHGRVHSIMRRGSAPTSAVIEVKYPASADTRAREDYTGMLEGLRQLEGKAMADRLSDRINLPQFLTQLAAASLFLNGDYWDELWLTGTQRLLGDGGIGIWYSFARWDAEDVFSPCRFEGRYEYKDPWQLSHCAESELAKLILKDPFTFRLYVDALEQVMQKITPKVFEQAIENTRSELLPYLSSRRIMHALKNAGEAVTTQAVSYRLDELAVLYLARREQLNRHINRYRLATK